MDGVRISYIELTIFLPAGKSSYGLRVGASKRVIYTNIQERRSSSGPYSRVSESEIRRDGARLIRIKRNPGVYFRNKTFNDDE